jgi:hypothetical protein
VVSRLCGLCECMCGFSGVRYCAQDVQGVQDVLGLCEIHCVQCVQWFVCAT